MHRGSHPDLGPTLTVSTRDSQPKCVGQLVNFGSTLWIVPFGLAAGRLAAQSGGFQRLVPPPVRFAVKVRGSAGTLWAGASEKDAELAQKLGQLQPFLAAVPPGCMGQLASFGADLTASFLAIARSSWCGGGMARPPDSNTPSTGSRCCEATRFACACSSSASGCIRGGSQSACEVRL